MFEVVFSFLYLFVFCVFIFLSFPLFDAVHVDSAFHVEVVLFDCLDVFDIEGVDFSEFLFELFVVLFVFDFGSGYFL